MSETLTATPSVVTAQVAPSTVVYAKITKAGNALYTFDYSKVDDERYHLIVTAGVTHLLNSKMSKVTKALIPDEEARKAEAWAIAEKNANELYGGTFKAGRKATTVTASASREEMTEAMRLARLAVKDAIRAQGGKLSHYSAADITAQAKLIVEGNPAIMAQAKTNLSSLVRAPSPIVIKEDPKKVAEAEARKAKAAAEKKVTLSAKQAGLPKKVEVVH